MTEALTQPAPETKSADVAAAFDEFARAFEAFKETNDERLAQIETRLSADVVTEEKLARIDGAIDEAKRRLDRMTLESRRPVLGAAAAEARDPAVAEHKAAFDLYVRAGEAAGLKRLEAKALSAGSGPDGGYLVPETIEREVLRRLSAISPIRAIASVRTISGGLYKRAFSTAGVAAGWIGETAARPQTTAATLAELAFPAMELYAQPAATQTLLDDAVVDVEQWIASEVETAFAEQEGAAFVRRRGQQAEGLPGLRHRRQRRLDLGQARLRADRQRRRLPGREPLGQARRPRLRAQGRLPPERLVRDEPEDAVGDPQVQG